MAAAAAAAVTGHGAEGGTGAAGRGAQLACEARIPPASVVRMKPRERPELTCRCSRRVQARRCVCTVQARGCGCAGALAWAWAWAWAWACA